MTPRAILVAVLLLGFSRSLPAKAQETGTWRPVSKTAQSITGGVTLNGERMVINFFSLPIAQIRPLKSDELLGAFPDADASTTTAHLYRLSIPADRHFLHKNTLCGSEETQWMATAVSGKELTLIFFSNATPPVFTVEALNNSTNLCGIFAYKR